MLRMPFGRHFLKQEAPQLKAPDPIVVKQAGGVARVMEEEDLRGRVGV